MGAIGRFARSHPLLLEWLGLAIGMVAVLVWATRDVALLPSQFLAILAATVLLAGACVWVISWE